MRNTQACPQGEFANGCSMNKVRKKEFVRQNPNIGRFLQENYALFFIPACLCTPDGQVFYWNHHAERVTGIAPHAAVGTNAHLQLFPSVPVLELFLQKDGLGNPDRTELERRFGKEHLLWDKAGNMTLLSCPPAGHAKQTNQEPETPQSLVLCGHWTNSETQESFCYFACAALADYEFTRSPSVDLYQLLNAVDRKENCWIGANQAELFCYLSEAPMHQLFSPDTTMADIMAMPMDISLAPAEALDHARTIAALTQENSEQTILHWPLTTIWGETFWTRSYPNIVTVNGQKANFSLMQDVTAEKKRDSALEAILTTYRLDKYDLFAQDLLTMFAGCSAPMHRTLETLLRAALSLVTVSIHGETGTGKNLAARLVHQLSSRSQGSFVTVNCGAIPEELFESTFFGHVKGAFTGAVMDKEGLLTKADTGTLFMDEIAELSPRAQAKLLQALSDKSYTPVGSTMPLTSKFRLIVATNRNLEDMVRQGTFREDLFYRVNVLDVHLPPLRERKNDIPLLVENILQRNHVPLTLAPDMIRRLQSHTWPGNIRELENVILRFAAENNLDFFTPVTLKENSFVAAPSENLTLKEQLQHCERNILVKSLTEHRWNKSKVAKKMGISRATLFRKLRELNLD